MARLSHTVDLTQGNPRWAVTRFAVPIFLSQLFQQLYNSVDSLIVGNFLGKEALASVSSSGSLIFLLVSFVSGTSLGAGVVIARYFGAGEREQVSRAIHTTVALGLVAGTLVSVLGVSLTPHILRWMGTAPDVLPGSIRYFRNYFIGGLSVVMYNMCKDVMTALGDSRRPLYYLIVSSLLNIVLDLLFVGVFRFGVGSAATATTIAQTVSALLCLRHLTSRRNEFRWIFAIFGFTGTFSARSSAAACPRGYKTPSSALPTCWFKPTSTPLAPMPWPPAARISSWRGSLFCPSPAFPWP